MDPEALVEEQIEDARRILREIQGVGCPAAVAGWMRLVRNDYWKLFIGFSGDAPTVDEAGRQASLAKQQLGIRSIDFLMWTSGPIDQPIYADLRAIRDRYPTMIARKLKSRRRIGTEDTRGLYLYPATFDLPAPDQVVRSVLGLLDRSGGAAPSVVTFRDGSRVHAVPVGIRLNTPDGARIDWHDVVTGVDRTVPAAEVVSIL